MDLSSYGLSIIKLAKKTCNVVSTVQERIIGTTQFKDSDTVKYTNLDCRYEQKTFSKFNSISQMVDVSKITGLFYLPHFQSEVAIEPLPQTDVIVFEGNRYEILFIERPSSPVYVKTYVQRK